MAEEEKGVEGVDSSVEAAGVEDPTDAPPHRPSGIITAALLDARCKHMVDNVDQLPAHAGFADLRGTPFRHLVTQLRPQVGDIDTDLDALPWQGTNTAEQALRDGVVGFHAETDQACASRILSLYTQLQRQSPGTSPPLLVLELAHEDVRPQSCHRLEALAKAGLGVTIGVLRIRAHISERGSHVADMLESCLPVMPNLRWLHVDDVPLAKLATAIGKCDDLSKLLHLTVSYSAGEGGGEEFGVAVQKATNLCALHLTDNKLTATDIEAIAPHLTTLSHLQDLDLSCNLLGSDGATELSKHLTSMVALRRLGLRATGIGPEGCTSIMKCVAQMAALRELDMPGCNLGAVGAKALAKQLVHAKGLRVLHLWQNDIKDDGATALASALSHLVELRELDVADNNFGPTGAVAIANALKGVTNLRGLHLAGNNIGTGLTPAKLKQFVAGVCSVERLRELDVSNTTMSTKQRAELLKTAFAQALPALELSVALFNYLVSRDTLEMAGFAVTESMTEFDTFTTFVRESWYSGKCWLPASVVLVGHQGAGKTTLATRLLTGKFDNTIVTTRGVEMSPWVLEAEAKQQQPAAAECEAGHGSSDRLPPVNLVDTGGQDVYAITHPFFFPQQAIYLLVWRAGEFNEHRDGLDQFFHSIVARARNAYIIPVLTCVEEAGPSPCMEGLAELRDVFASSRKDKHYIEIGPEIHVSSKVGTGLPELCAAIAERMKQPNLHVAKSYLALKTKLAEKGTATPLCRRSEVLARDIISTCGFQNLAAAPKALQLLHELGMVIDGKWAHGAGARRIQPADPAARDEEDPLVVLDPAWLANAFRSIVRHDTVNGLQNGVLKHSMASELWRKDGVDETDAASLLQLIHDLGAALVLKTKDGEPTEESIVPAILPRHPADEKLSWRKLLALGNDSSDRKWVMSSHEFVLGTKDHLFVPRDFMPRLLSHSHAFAPIAKSDGAHQVWKDCCVYEGPSGDRIQSRAVVALERDPSTGRTKLVVAATGAYPYSMWQTLCTCVDTTVSHYDDWTMNWCWLVHCPDCGDAVLPLGSSGEATPVDNRTPVDSQHASFKLWREFPHFCRVPHRMTSIQLGDIVSCDVMLRNIGFDEPFDASSDASCHTDHITIRRDQAAHVRLQVLRSINALVQDCQETAGRCAGVDQVPRCWFPVFRHTSDDRQGVVLVPVCESADHVHPVRTSNEGYTVALSFDEVCQCSQYLWRVACMVEAAALSVGDGVSAADREKYACVRKRMYRIMNSESSNSHSTTWPGSLKDLRVTARSRPSSQAAPLRNAVMNQGHSPGGSTWVCKLACGHAYHHPVPQPPTRFVRRLALVIGVSKYSGAFTPLENCPRSAKRIASMLKEVGFVRRYDAPCVESLEGLDGNAAPWLDKNVHVITDDDGDATGAPQHGVSLQKLDGAVKGLRKAAEEACKQAVKARKQACEQAVEVEAAQAARHDGHASVDHMHSHVKGSKESSAAVEADRPGCLVLVFVSGHGQQCGGRHYLLPSNSTGIKANSDLAACRRVALDMDKIPSDLDKDNERRHVFIGLEDMCRKKILGVDVARAFNNCDTFVMRACQDGASAFAGRICTQFSAGLLANLPCFDDVASNLGRISKHVGQATDWTQMPVSGEGGAPEYMKVWLHAPHFPGPTSGGTALSTVGGCAGLPPH